VTNKIAAQPRGTTLSLSAMLKDAIVDTDGKPLGRLRDVVIELRQNQYPLFSGLVIGVGTARAFVPANDVLSMDSKSIRLRSGRVSLLPFERRDGEVLLKQDVLGHRLIDIARSALVRAFDVRFTLSAAGWVATALDVHKHRWFQFGSHENHPARDWHTFLLLLGHPNAAKANLELSRIRRLKPAQIADMIESASAQEQNLLLAQVHTDPELEADVFEELDDDKKSQLLNMRSDQAIADILSRMHSDDVADTVMDLPQGRRRKVLDLLPPAQSAKVLALLGYNEATAGGLMGTDYLALPEERTIADALIKVRMATTQQPEAMTIIHTLRPDGTLAGTLSLVRALQLNPATVLKAAADPQTVVASSEDDIIAITTRMADFNLLSLPVLDADGRMLGIVTVDDALEAAIQRDWFERKKAHH
jgi:CBS domain-containing protein/sporulation protein YlmC with PRC-barrel domain